MRITRAIWIVVLTSTGSASSVDAQSRVNRTSNTPHAQVSRPPMAGRAARAAGIGVNVPAERALVAGSETRGGTKGFPASAHFRVERQKTPFVAQIRLPLAHLWNGRIEVAVMRQSMRDMHSHSALPQADQAGVLRPDRIPYLQPASRTSYGGGIWLTFGRPRGAERKAS